MRTLQGPAPELGHSHCIYRVCSISLFYALIIHIMRTFFTASVISIHLWSKWSYCIVTHITFQRTSQLTTQLVIVLVSASSNKPHFLKRNHKAADKHIFYHCNRIKLCMAVILWFYTDSCVYILPCHHNWGRWPWLSKHSLQCIELMVKLKRN